MFVAMSGGVDSSVAALLLQKGEYDITGVFIRCFNIDGCAERDVEDARRTAERLNIPFYNFDFEEEYKEKVVQDMIKGYAKGITPNPDVMCNKEIKFGLFLKKALALGADYIATGHYVRITRSPDTLAQGVSGATPKSYPSQEHQASLCTARDKNKDQSYFLWTLTQKQLKHCLFPIGDYLKPEVRNIAREAELPTAEKKDSQGICFLGKVALRDFLEEYIPQQRGAVVTTDGRKVGEHQGVQFYTIGQRHLGIESLASTGGHTQPHYVVKKDIETNTVVVAEEKDDPALYRKKIGLRDVNFIDPSLRFKASDLRVLARIRYRQPLTPATLYNLTPKTYNLEFDEPVKFVAPGQSAVFYTREGELLGGGIIQ